MDRPMRQGWEKRKRKWVETDIDPDRLKLIKVAEEEAVHLIDKLNAVIKSNTFVDWDVAACHGCRQVTINEEMFDIACDGENGTHNFCEDCTSYCKTCNRRYAWDMEPVHDHGEMEESESAGQEIVLKEKKS